MEPQRSDAVVNRALAEARLGQLRCSDELLLSVRDSDGATIPAPSGRFLRFCRTFLTLGVHPARMHPAERVGAPRQ